MKIFQPILISVMGYFYSVPAMAGIFLPMIQSKLDSVKLDVHTVGGYIISLVAALVSITVILKILVRADPAYRASKAAPVRKPLSGSAAVSRYGKPLSRHTYQNHVTDALYSRAEFKAFSARLAEREAEFLANQKRQGGHSADDLESINAQLADATASMYEFEREEEDLRAEIAAMSCEQASEDEDELPEDEEDFADDDNDYQNYDYRPCEGCGGNDYTFSGACVHCG